MQVSQVDVDTKHDEHSCGQVEVQGVPEYPDLHMQVFPINLPFRQNGTHWSFKETNPFMQLHF